MASFLPASRGTQVTKLPKTDNQELSWTSPKVLLRKLLLHLLPALLTSAFWGLCLFWSILWVSLRSTNQSPAAAQMTAVIVALAPSPWWTPFSSSLTNPQLPVPQSELSEGCMCLCRELQLQVAVFSSKLAPFVSISSAIKAPTSVLKTHSLCSTRPSAWSLSYFSSAKVFPSEWKLKFDFIFLDLRTLVSWAESKFPPCYCTFHTLPEASVL